MNSTAKRASVILATASFMALGCSGTGLADVTSGDSGALSGNQVHAPVSVPVNVSGNALSVLGQAAATSDGRAAVRNGGHHRRATRPSVLPSVEQAPTSAPANPVTRTPAKPAAPEPSASTPAKTARKPAEKPAKKPAPCTCASAPSADANVLGGLFSALPRSLALPLPSTAADLPPELTAPRKTGPNAAPARGRDAAPSRTTHAAPRPAAAAAPRQAPVAETPTVTKKAGPMDPSGAERADGRQLPFTGTNAGALAGLAAGFLALGAGAIYMASRRLAGRR